MTEQEICSSFRRCYDRIGHLDILRDLTLLPKSDILDILIKNNLVSQSDPDYQELFNSCKPKRKRKTNTVTGRKVDKTLEKQLKTAGTVGKSVAKPTQTAMENPKQTVMKKPVTVEKPVPQEPVKTSTGVSKQKISSKSELRFYTEDGTLIKFIEMQLCTGVTIQSISNSLGISMVSLTETCQKFGINLLDFSKSCLDYHKIKQNLSDCYKYTSYLSAYTYFGYWDDIRQILKKQYKLMTTLSSYTFIKNDIETVKKCIKNIEKSIKAKEFSCIDSEVRSLSTLISDISSKITLNENGGIIYGIYESQVC